MTQKILKSLQVYFDPMPHLPEAADSRAERLAAQDYIELVRVKVGAMDNGRRGVRFVGLAEDVVEGEKRMLQLGNECEQNEATLEDYDDYLRFQKIKEVLGENDG